LYVLSYDEPDALADYARAHGVSFPMLSDPDSEIIERLGILNTLIDPDDHPWYGIPFPGSYVLDSAGTITHKFFEDRLHFRPSSDELLRAATGQEVKLPPAPQSSGEASEVSFDVVLDGLDLQSGIVRDLVIRFALPEGQHLYGEPVPQGLVATTVEIDEQPGMLVRHAVYPPSTPLTLATGEVLNVFEGSGPEGEVLVRVPVAQLSRRLTTLDCGDVVQRITGTVRWQACDDQACGLPRTETFVLEVPAAPAPRPEDEFQATDGMDIRTHFVGMVARRTDKPLAEIMSNTEGTANE